jgi:hypothetical protein
MGRHRNRPQSCEGDDGKSKKLFFRSLIIPFTRVNPHHISTSYEYTMVFVFSLDIIISYTQDIKMRVV